MNKEQLALKHLEYELLRLRVIHPSGCWTRSGPKHHNVIYLYGRLYQLHRVSACIYLDLDIANESIQVNHKIECLYPGCFNPEHIYLGNQSENIKDQVNKGTHRNSSKTHCIRGHKFDQFRYKGGKISSRRCSECRRIYG